LIEDVNTILRSLVKSPAEAVRDCQRGSTGVFTIMKSTEAFYKNLLDNLYDGLYFVDKDRRITYWNRGAERITGYRSDEVTGRCCADNILKHIDEKGTPLCEGGCPLSETLADGGLRSAEIYLLHKDGHRVPISVRVAPVHDARGKITGAVEIFTDNTPHAAALERIAEYEKIIYIDPLTELANRRYTEITLNARYEEMERYGWPFGVVFIDIDHFKKINDRYGHDVGDEVLKMVARTLSKSLRSFDVLGRWGGEEFIGVIANVDADELIMTANRFRMLVEQSRFAVGSPDRVTISLGATLARPGDTIADLLKRADKLMYESKAAGRNRVTLDV
jgi:diguanylate cyclase (GGDEF)-like protein/PAS domain S-box-containing protein